MPTHEIIFVGAGPGDPDLLTIAGLKALEEADLVVHAGSLVNPEILKFCHPDCLLVDSAPLNLEEITSRLIKAHHDGMRTVRLHTGDPSLYGAIHEQMTILKQAQVPYRVIPGITAAMAGASSLGLEFTIPELTQTLIITRIEGRTPMPPGEDLAALAAHGSSLALYLSASRGKEVGQVLSLAYGPDSPIALCYRISWPDSRIIWTTSAKLAETLDTEKLDRHTLILIGPAVAALKNSTKVPESRLYNSGFSHACRNKSV